ncbi:DUF3108 domain-containing protein [Nitrosomonas sp. Nm51]|uniref:DUF3108 domain-containing protein n=1 Tax=Nitrosomonas sp. Nm51 TaxID=133720 RepID=UPI0015A5885F|nr:DUF3108 domain-containing protein [Nitrosomonas sp. Nm51]
MSAENNPGTENSTAADSSAHIHISYIVKTGIGHGELNETVDINQESDVHTFSITSNAQATGIFKIINPGSIIRSSQGIVTEKGLKPTRYSDQRTNSNSSLALFDWEKEILTLKHGTEEKQTPLQAGTLDRLSLSYHFIFSCTHELQAGNLLGIHVTDGRSLQLMQFKISSEKLSTPLGELDTIVLTKLRNSDDKIQRKIWLAPDYHMIPVHIQSVEKDGLDVDKMIAELHIDYATDITCCTQ